MNAEHKNNFYVIKKHIEEKSKTKYFRNDSSWAIKLLRNVVWDIIYLGVVKVCNWRN